MPINVFKDLDNDNIHGELQNLTTLGQFAYVVRNIDSSATSRELSLKMLHDYIPAYLRLLKDLQRVALNHAIGLDYFDELKKEEEVLLSLKHQLRQMMDDVG